MKINYDLIFNETIEEIKKNNQIPSILLHSCCGPCSSAVIERMAPYFNITILYYNPNIEPYEEYLHRKEEQIRLLKELSSKYKISFLDCDYENENFRKITTGLEEEPEGGARCPVCFRLRLEKTALLAKEQNYQYFGTTLTVSPHKDSQIINKIGEVLSKEYNIKYLYADFKKQSGYQRSIELSKIYDLYRQDYCGCSFANKK